jgi:hypothetical protein
MKKISIIAILSLCYNLASAQDYKFNEAELYIKKEIVREINAIQRKASFIPLEQNKDLDKISLVIAKATVGDTIITYDELFKKIHATTNITMLGASRHMRGWFNYITVEQRTDSSNRYTASEIIARESEKLLKLCDYLKRRNLKGFIGVAVYESEKSQHEIVISYGTYESVIGCIEMPGIEEKKRNKTK